MSIECRRHKNGDYCLVKKCVEYKLKIFLDSPFTLSESIQYSWV